MNKPCANGLRVVWAAVLMAMLTAALAAQTSSPKPLPKKNPASKAPAEKAAKPVPEAPAPKPTDVKIHSRYTANAQVTENTTYFKGARQRFEYPGLAIITQCDSKRTIELNDKSKRFLVQPLQEAQPDVQSQPAAPATAPGLGAQPSPSAGGLLTYTTTLVDTGERKDMFGREARHIKSTTVKEASANACDKRVAKIETDAWYVDLPERVAECESAPAQTPRQAAQTSPASCTDRIETRQNGDAKLGFAVLSTVTTTDDKDVTTMSTEVDNLQVTSLDAGLFDVPAGYAEAKSQSDLLAAAGNEGATLTDALFGSLADGTRTVAPKKAGTVRVGVADTANRSGGDVSSATMRSALVGSMNKVPFEAVPLLGSTPADLERDAQTKECDYILTSDLAELRSSKPNKVSGLLKKASRDSSSELVHDARIDFTLYTLADRDKPLFASSAKVSSGGFGVSSALRLASTAGSLYMMMPMMMLGPLAGAGGFGMPGLGMGVGGMGGGSGLSRLMMAPSMGAAMSIISPAALGGGISATHGPQQSGDDSALQRTLLEACDKVGRAAMERLRGR
jgi:hypothetical protein